MNVSYDFRLRAAEFGHVLEITSEETDWLSACSCGSWSSTDRIQAHSDPTITWAQHVIDSVGRKWILTKEGRAEIK